VEVRGSPRRHGLCQSTTFLWDALWPTIPKPTSTPFTNAHDAGVPSTHDCRHAHGANIHVAPARHGWQSAQLGRLPQ
jgi:hypothetical protein